MNCLKCIPKKILSFCLSTLKNIFRHIIKFYNNISPFHKKSFFIFIATLFCSYYPIWSPLLKDTLISPIGYSLNYFYILQSSFIILISSFVKHIISVKNDTTISDNELLICLVIVAVFLFIPFIPDASIDESSKKPTYTYVLFLVILLCNAILYYIIYLDKLSSDTDIRNDINSEKFTANRIDIPDDDNDLNITL